MKQHRLSFREVDRNIFDQIKNGTKTIDSRAATSKFSKIEAGDELIFVCGSDTLIKTVQAVAKFDSVESIFASADFSSILPGVESLDDAKAIYYSFPNYEDKINQFGLVALYLK